MIWSPLAGLYLVGILLYLLVAKISAMRAATRLSDVAGIVWAFLILHVSYGWGYLHGIWDLLVLRREPGTKSHTLTR